MRVGGQQWKKKYSDPLLKLKIYVLLWYEWYSDWHGFLKLFSQFFNFNFCIIEKIQIYKYQAMFLADLYRWHDDGQF